MKTIFAPCAPLALAAAAWLCAGCEPEVKYDDAGSVTLSQDWSDTDIRATADELGASLAEALEKKSDIVKAATKPSLLVLDVKNRTDKHLNTRIIADRIETAVSKSDRVNLVAGEARETLAKEYEYNASGMVNPKTQKGPGLQQGVDYILAGTLESVPVRQGSTKVEYYYIKMYLVNIQTNVKLWQDEKEIKKRIKK
jgi:hypothetical protein